MGFVMVLSHSRRNFLRIYLNAGMENFLRGHVEDFEVWQGVPRELWYDNLKSVDLERRCAAIRFNPRFLDFAGDYRSQALHGTAPPWRPPLPRRSRRRVTDGLLAHGGTRGGPTGPTQQTLRLARSPPPLSARQGLIRSNRRGTDPYARWCGRGGTAR